MRVLLDCIAAGLLSFMFAVHLAGALATVQMAWLDGFYRDRFGNIVRRTAKPLTTQQDANVATVSVCVCMLAFLFCLAELGTLAAHGMTLGPMFSLLLGSVIVALLVGFPISVLLRLRIRYMRRHIRPWVEAPDECVSYGVAGMMLAAHLSAFAYLVYNIFIDPL